MLQLTMMIRDSSLLLLLAFTAAGRRRRRATAVAVLLRVLPEARWGRDVAATAAAGAVRASITATLMIFVIVVVPCRTNTTYDIPSAPNVTYAGEGWVSWADSLGYGEEV